MTKAASLSYGVVCYLIFLATFLYALGFVGNLIVPKSIDSGQMGALAEAVAVNVLLLGLFPCQKAFGGNYEEYRRQVGMLLPRIGGPKR